MAIKNKKVARRLKIRKRIRGRIQGTATIPRLAVFKSNTGIYAQLIDDQVGNTLVAASSKMLKFPRATVENATQVGELIATKALEKGIQKIVFDRSGYVYHGKVQQLAQGARGKGLKF